MINALKIFLYSGALVAWSALLSWLTDSTLDHVLLWSLLGAVAVLVVWEPKQ